MSRLTAIDPTTATGEAKELLDGVQTKLGMAPNIVRTMANSPAVLKAFLGFGEALSGGRFDARSREAFALAVAGVNSYEYCAAAHTAVTPGCFGLRLTLGMLASARHSRSRKRTTSVRPLVAAT